MEKKEAIAIIKQMHTFFSTTLQQHEFIHTAIQVLEKLPEKKGDN